MYNETNDTYYRPAHWGVSVKIGETFFDAYRWTFQGYYEEEIFGRETDIPAKWMKPWEDIRY